MKEKIGKYFTFLLLFVIGFLIFRNWFEAGLLAGGDFQIYYKEMFPNFYFFPEPAWNWTLNAGLGANGTSLLWNYITVQIPIVTFGNMLGFSWPIVQRFGYLYPLLALLFISPFFVSGNYLNFHSIF